MTFEYFFSTTFSHLVDHDLVHFNPIVSHFISALRKYTSLQRKLLKLVVKTGFFLKPCFRVGMENCIITRRLQPLKRTFAIGVSNTKYYVLVLTFTKCGLPSKMTGNLKNSFRYKCVKYTQNIKT